MQVKQECMSVTQANGHFSRFKRGTKRINNRIQLLVMDVVSYTILSLDDESWRYSKRKRYKRRNNLRKWQKHIILKCKTSKQLTKKSWTKKKNWFLSFRADWEKVNLQSVNSTLSALVAKEQYSPALMWTPLHTTAWGWSREEAQLRGKPPGKDRRNLSICKRWWRIKIRCRLLSERKIT